MLQFTGIFMENLLYLNVGKVTLKVILKGCEQLSEIRKMREEHKTSIRKCLVSLCHHLGVQSRFQVEDVPDIGRWQRKDEVLVTQKELVLQKLPVTDQSNGQEQLRNNSSKFQKTFNWQIKTFSPVAQMVNNSPTMQETRI